MKTYKTLLSEVTHLLNEDQKAGKISASGLDGDRHKKEYLDPYIGSKTATHTMASTSGTIEKGARVKIHKVVNENGKNHAHVEDEHGNQEKVLVSKLHKPLEKHENEGHKFENQFIDHLKKHGLMEQDAEGAGSTAGTDFHVINKKTNVKHAGKVRSEFKASEYNGETKQDHTAAMGQLTINHHPERGWHISDKARALRPEYSTAIEKAGILDYMNKHHPDPHKEKTTSSGRAQSISIKHPNMSPAEAYLKDHHVDLLHVGGGKGTYAVGKDKTGHGLPNIEGKGKWTVREKQRGNKSSRTVMFQPDGKYGLNPSTINLENEEHIKAFKKTLGHND